MHAVTQNYKLIQSLIGRFKKKWINLLKQGGFTLISSSMLNFAVRPQSETGVWVYAIWVDWLMDFVFIQTCFSGAHETASAADNQK